MTVNVDNEKTYDYTDPALSEISSWWRELQPIKKLEHYAAGLHRSMVPLLDLNWLVQQ